MAKLIYVSIMSIDGYIGDGDYNWSNPGDGGHDFITEVTRPIGTYLYGRRMYETMSFWEPENLPPGMDEASLNYARLWQATDKIVYSKSMRPVSSPKTRIEREFDPKVINDMKAKLTHDFSIGGPNIAAQAIRANLVDEYQLFVVPKILGRGLRVMPDGCETELELLEERRFGDGWLYLRYKTKK